MIAQSQFKVEALYPRREIVNAIFYVTRNGGAWRAMPHDLPPYRIVFHDFRLWQRDGTWERIHAALRTKVRQQAGKTPKPSAASKSSRSGGSPTNLRLAQSFAATVEVLRTHVGKRCRIRLHRHDSSDGQTVNTLAGFLDTL